MKKNTRYVIQLSIGIAVLFIGCLAYLALRKGVYAFDLLLQSIGLDHLFAPIRQAAHPLDAPDFITYSMPAGLWALAYIIIIDAIWKPFSVKTKLLITSIVPMLGVGSELMQLFCILPGTYDSLDLLAYIAPYLIYALIICRKHQPTESKHETK